MYKKSREVETGTTWNKSSCLSERDLNSERPNHSAALPQRAALTVCQYSNRAQGQIYDPYKGSTMAQPSMAQRGTQVVLRK